jgi:hypothetical protein
MNHLTLVTGCTYSSIFHSICKNSLNQSWPGLKIVPNLPFRGRGVFTTRQFTKGALICDYHGRLLKIKDVERLRKMLTIEAERLLTK